MLNIKDQVFISLKIDGSEIEYINIREITLAEGNGSYAPTIKLVLDDPISLLSKSRALSEGNKIEIRIARSQKEQVETREYLIFSPIRNNPVNNPTINIVGLLDCPLYFTKSARESRIGNTTSVISEVASDCGLKYEGPEDGRQTNDKQTWLDVCTTRARFVHQIVRHAYMDDQSCMSAVVTSYKKLKYKNIVDLMSAGKAKFTFTHNSQESSSDSGKTTYLVKEAKDKSNSGVMANWHNYGSTRAHNNIDGFQKNKRKCRVKVAGEYVAVNQDIADSVERTRIEYAPIDCTNTHCKYEPAVYQNMKILAVFSESIALLVDVVTDVQLFDTIIYRQADAKITDKVRNEDVYLVVGKTIVVRGGIHYAERIQCARPSLTMKGQTNLKRCLDGSNKGGGGGLEDYDEASDAGRRSEGGVGGGGGGVGGSNYSDMSVGSFGGKQSVISAPSINAASIGSGIANINAITSILNGLKGIKNLNSGMAGSLSQITGLISSLLGPVGDLARGLGVGNPATIQSSLSTVLQGMGSLQQYSSQFEQMSRSTPDAVSGLVRLLQQRPRALSNSALTGIGGPMDMILNSIKALAITGNVSSIAQYAYQMLPQNIKNTPEASALSNAALSTINSMSYASGNTANVWNQVVSGLSQSAIPTNIAGGDFMLRWISFISNPNVTKEQMMTFLAVELQRQTAGRPNYMGTSGMTYPQQTGMNTQNLSNMTKNLG